MRRTQYQLTTARPPGRAYLGAGYQAKLKARDSLFGLFCSLTFAQPYAGAPAVLVDEFDTAWFESGGEKSEQGDFQEKQGGD